MLQPAAGSGMSPEHRAAILEEALETELRHGAIVEFQMEGFAVVRYDNRLRNGLHFLATLLTVGLWLPVWLYLAFRRKEVKYELRVERRGNVTRRKHRG